MNPADMLVRAARDDNANDRLRMVASELLAACKLVPPAINRVKDMLSDTKVKAVDWFLVLDCLDEVNRVIAKAEGRPENIG